MDAIPIEEALLRPVASLLLAAIVPWITAALLWRVLVGRDLPGEIREQARVLAPFRTAAFVVGLVQIQLAWMIGATALGPRWVEAPDGLASDVLGALCAIVAFASGGGARTIEEPSRGPRDVAAAIALRLRLVPVLGGPVIAASIAARLPVVDGEAIAWPVVLLSALVVALGAAFGGLALGVATGALRPATDEVRAIARDAASAEGVSLAAVLRLPTGGARFTNAAAIPWARTMIVTDRIVSLLSASELRAVLAHEAGHLSEGWRVVGARLGTAIVLLFVLTTGVRIGGALHPAGSLAALAIGVLLAVPALILVRRLARRMEERADARARATAGAPALADALLKLHEDARMPLVTGARRVHPDLYDRLIACGRDPGPRPSPPRRRAGLVTGVVVGAGLVACVVGVQVLTSIDERDAAATEADAAWARLRVDPWDPDAMIALAWDAAAARDLALAERRGALAVRMGATPPQAMELEAELLASRGECEGARERFDAALRARAERAFDALWEPLELGGFHVPPSLVRDCAYGAPSPLTAP